jgi:hypothetical protein
MFVLNRPLLSMESILINVLMALDLIVSKCSLHIIHQRLHQDILSDLRREYSVRSMKDEPQLVYVY